MKSLATKTKSSSSGNKKNATQRISPVRSLNAATSTQVRDILRPHHLKPDLIIGSANYSSGRALDSTIKSYFEPHIGNKISEVRVHSDERAARLSKSLGADAFTYGNNIYFNENRFNPESTQGKGLLAHELAHVAQQESLGGPFVQRRVDFDVTQTSLTHAAVEDMTIVEMREQLALLQLPLSGPEAEVQDLNRSLIEERLTELEIDVYAMSVQLLAQRTRDETQSFTDVMLGAGGLVHRTIAANDNAVENFIDNATAPTDSFDMADVFSMVLSVLPFAGPIARWIGDNNYRKALDTLVRAGISESVEYATGGGGVSVRAFTGSARSESQWLMDALNDHASTVLAAYRHATTQAEADNNAPALAEMYIMMQHLAAEARSVTANGYVRLQDKLEIQLYRRYYSTRAHLEISTSSSEFPPFTVIRTYRLRGLPNPVENRILQQLHAYPDREALARAWGLRNEQRVEPFGYEYAPP